MKRIVEDLHGNIFEMGDYSISDAIPPSGTFGTNEHKKFNRDLVSNESFISITYGENNDQYAYTFYANSVYVYGLLNLIGHNPKNDIRHVKEKNI